MLTAIEAKQISNKNEHKEKERVSNEIAKILDILNHGILEVTEKGLYQYGYKFAYW